MMVVVVKGLDVMISGMAVAGETGAVEGEAVEVEVGSDGSTSGGMIVGQKYLKQPWAEDFTTWSHEVGQSGREEVAKL